MILTKNAEPAKTELRFISVKDVAAKLGVSDSTVYEWMNPRSKYFDASFPQGKKVGRSRKFFEHLIEEYMENL